MCEWTVPVSAAGRDKHRRNGEKPCDECRIALNDKFRQYRASKPPGTWRAAHLWALYRIRLPEYTRLLEDQDDRCAICLSEFKGSRDRHLDHEHGCDHPDKGYVCCAKCVRGVLCHKCNTGLSIMENEARLARALLYLGGTLPAGGDAE